MIRREVQDNGSPNSNKKGKDSCHSHSRETKSVYHDNNQNKKKLKRDNLTDTHTRKATFAKGVNKIDLKHSLPQPLPRANTHTHKNINPSPTQKKIIIKKKILTQETAVAAYALSE